MLLVYHGSIELKNQVLAEMKAHRESDRLIKGKYWEDGKGCAVGCLLKSGNHIEYEEKFGIPVHLAYLEDGLFEGLTKEKAMLWPERFLDAFEPGKDYSKTWYKFAVWLLFDPQDGIIKHATQEETEVIRSVAKLYQLAAAGIAVTQKDWEKVADAAYAAANVSVANVSAYAANAYAAAYVAYAAYAPANVVAAANTYANVADADAYKLMADKLIEIIKGE
jgi:hypothetical protein